MLLYSVIVSPGYFAQLGQWALVGMFALLLVLAVASIGSLLRAKPATTNLPRPAKSQG